MVWGGLRMVGPAQVPGQGRETGFDSRTREQVDSCVCVCVVCVLCVCECIYVVVEAKTYRDEYFFLHNIRKKNIRHGCRIYLLSFHK